jgi:hypothetical protein
MMIVADLIQDSVDWLLEQLKRIVTGSAGRIEKDSTPHQQA